MASTLRFGVLTSTTFLSSATILTILENCACCRNHSPLHESSTNPIPPGEGKGTSLGFGQAFASTAEPFSLTSFHYLGRELLQSRSFFRDSYPFIPESGEPMSMHSSRWDVGIFCPTSTAESTTLINFITRDESYYTTVRSFEINIFHSQVGKADIRVLFSLC